MLLKRAAKKRNKRQHSTPDIFRPCQSPSVTGRNNRASPETRNGGRVLEPLNSGSAHWRGFTVNNDLTILR